MAPDDSTQLQMAPEMMAPKAGDQFIKKNIEFLVSLKSSEYVTLTPQLTISIKVQMSHLGLIT